MVVGYPAPDQLQRHALPELVVVALGQVHGAHSAPADLSYHAERPDPRRGPAGGERRDVVPVYQRDADGGGGDLQEVVAPIVRVQETMDRGAELGIGGTRAIDERGSLVGWEVERPVQEGIRLPEEMARIARRNGGRSDPFRGVVALRYVAASAYIS
jgi:hypothetical protein